MSATAQGFIHYYECVDMIGAYGDGAQRECRSWAQRLVSYIRADFNVPEHIELKPAGPVLMKCQRCEEYRMGVSPNSVGFFIDEHRYCGELSVDVWRCPHCNHHEFTDHVWCRWCETKNTGQVVGRVAPKDVYKDTAMYTIYRQLDRTGVIKIGSLREALRAVRAIYPHEEAAVALGNARWNTYHECK